MAGVQIEKIVFTNKNQVFDSYLCFSDFKDVAKELLYNSLSKEDIKMLEKIKSDKRKKSFLIGRKVAKIAVNYLTDYKCNEDIWIENGIFNYPVLVSKAINNVQISISHCDGFAAAVAFPEHCPLGVDAESVDLESIEAIESSLGFGEKEIINKLYSQYGNKLFIVLWTAKEALAKVIKTGITIPFYLFEVEDMWGVDNFLFCKYKYFNQFNAISITEINHVITIAYPQKCVVSVDSSYLSTL